MDILIIDDEITARSYLYSTLHSAGYDTVREAGNGKLAFEMIREKEPDIIIADIRMPEMDGIELLKLLRENHYKTVYILLSGYEIFSSAQEALRQNAYAYLLKPVSDEELLQTVDGAARQLELRRRQEDQSIINERNSFISSLVFQRQTDQTYISEKSRSLFTQLPYNHYAIALFKIQPQPQNGLSSFLDDIEKTAQDILRENDIASYSFIEEQSLIFLLSLPAAFLIEKNRLTRLFREIREQCRRAVHPNLYNSIGYVTSELSELHASYQYAYRMLRQSVETENNRTAINDDSWSLTSEQQELLLNKLNNRDSDGIDNQLADIYAPFFANHYLSAKYEEHLKNITLQLLLLFTGFLTGKLIDSNLLGEEFSLYQELSKLDNAEAALNWIRQKASQTLALSAETVESTDSDAVNAARQYILEHLSDPLTLESVAGIVHLSPGYLSRLFKEQTGNSFIQYVTGARINEAKRFLLDPYVKAKDVGELVGYHDAKHFYKTFKSVTGFTPGAYRKRFSKESKK